MHTAKRLWSGTLRYSAHFGFALPLKILVHIVRLNLDNLWGTRILKLKHTLGVVLQLATGFAMALLDSCELLHFFLVWNTSKITLLVLQWRYLIHVNCLIICSVEYPKDYFAGFAMGGHDSCELLHFFSSVEYLKDHFSGFAMVVLDSCVLLHFF